MFIPEGYTEEEVVDAVRTVARKVGQKYKFGHYDLDDLEQEALIMIMSSDVLQKYNPDKPLHNFLYTHLNWRFFNFKRNNYTKPNPPCVRCPLKAFIKPDICTAYENKEECKPYKKWIDKNNSKKNIIETLHIDVVRDAADENNMYYFSEFSSDIEDKSVHEYLMTNLSKSGRKLYLMLMNNCKIKTNLINKLAKEIESLMANYRS